MFVKLQVILLALIAATSNPDVRQEVTIEIYNRDQALIREVRMVDLEKGLNTVDFHGIADGIYGHTISIRPQGKEAVLREVSVSYNYDLVDNDKLLKFYVGKWFSFSTEDLEYEGRLLRIDDKHIFLQPDTTKPGLEVVDRGSLVDMRYPEVPGGMFLEPTIRWKVSAKKRTRKLPVKLAYLTSDITWMCDYRMEIATDSTAHLSAHFTLSNNLPISFHDCAIALIAGETSRSDDPEGGDGSAVPSRIGQAAEGTGGRFFEYYRYSIPRRMDLDRDQTVMIPFFEPREVRLKKEFVYPHSLEGEQVSVRLRVANDESQGLGIPLPEGDIGIYARVDDGGFSFLGEDFLPPTPVGGEAELVVGRAFNLSAKRMRLTQRRPQRDQHEETWRVEISSDRNDTTIVRVQQRVFGYFEVASRTVDGVQMDFEQESAQMLIFPVHVLPHSKAVLEYTIEYGY